MAVNYIQPETIENIKAESIKLNKLFSPQRIGDFFVSKMIDDGGEDHLLVHDTIAWKFYKASERFNPDIIKLAPNRTIWGIQTEPTRSIFCLAPQSGKLITQLVKEQYRMIFYAKDDTALCLRENEARFDKYILRGEEILHDKSIGLGTDQPVYNIVHSGDDVLFTHGPRADNVSLSYFVTNGTCVDLPIPERGVIYMTDRHVIIMSRDTNTLYCADFDSVIDEQWKSYNLNSELYKCLNQNKDKYIIDELAVAEVEGKLLACVQPGKEEGGNSHVSVLMVIDPQKGYKLDVVDVLKCNGFMFSPRVIDKYIVISANGPVYSPKTGLKTNGAADIAYDVRKDKDIVNPSLKHIKFSKSPPSLSMIFNAAIRTGTYAQGCRM